MEKFATVFCFLLAQASTCIAQQVEYNRHLLEVQHEIPQWRADVLQVDVDRLSISYQDGKLIEQAKVPALENLDTASLLVSRILLRHHLADEISLFGILGEINFSITMLDDDLLSIAGDKDRPTVERAKNGVAGAWGGPFARINNRPVDPGADF